jgi:hypothetical protein
MSLLNKAKETVVEYTVLTVLAGIGILTVILWQAVPSTFWEGISNAVERKVLWALIGLLFLIIIGESIYIIQNSFRTQKVLKHFGGVLWSVNSELFCPKDEIPLHQAGKIVPEPGSGKETIEFFQCPKCDNEYILKDLEGNQVPFAKAKQYFYRHQNPKPPHSTPLTNPEESLDETTIEVLKGFGTTTLAYLEVANFTGLIEKGIKPVRISHSIDLLNQKGLIVRSRTQYIKGGNTLYELSPKGRAYIVKNNFL